MNWVSISPLSGVKEVQNEKKKIEIKYIKNDFLSGTSFGAYPLVRLSPMFGALSPINKSFCGVQGRFLQKEPLAAGGIIALKRKKPRMGRLKAFKLFYSCPSCIRKDPNVEHLYDAFG
jgi:hypothetical protein